MDAFQWFHLLTPLAVVICIATLLSGLAAKRTTISKTNHILAIIGYAGAALGWLIMRFAISLHSADTITMIAAISWLILMPALILLSINTIWRLTREKNSVAIETGRFLAKVLTACVGVLVKVMSACWIVAKPILKNMRHDSEEEEEPPKPQNPLADPLKRPFSLSVMYPNSEEFDALP